MRSIIVGTQNSITAYVMDNDLTPEDYFPVKSAADAREISIKKFPDLGEKVIITYGYKQLPVLDALGISDILISSGFARKNWRYV